MLPNKVWFNPYVSCFITSCGSSLEEELPIFHRMKNGDFLLIYHKIGNKSDYA